MMNDENKKRNYLGVILLGASMPITIELGSYYHLSIALIMVFVVLEGLLCASSFLWAHANKKPTGSEWWQDDDASGWRGY